MDLEKTLNPYNPEKDYDSHERWQSGYDKAEQRIKKGGPQMMESLKFHSSDAFVKVYRDGVLAAIDDFCNCFGV